MIKDQRHLDHPGEQAVHMFLMKYFYPMFHQHEEVSDRAQQIAGIDMKLCVNNHWFTVDEKAQLTRLNQKITPYTTQALEILSRNRDGNFRYGWIFNDQTDYYLFTYITECQTENKKDLTYDKIQRARTILISKQQIVRMLLEQNISLTNLKTLAHLMIHQNYFTRQNDKGNTYIDLTAPIWLCHTNPKSLAEEPVNCVIRWSLYEQYAWHVYDITPTGVVQIK